MTFYTKEINQVLSKLGPREVEYLARIQIQTFLKQNYSAEEIRQDVRELLELESRSPAVK